MLRLLDRIFVLLLVMLTAALVVLWLRSYLVGDRYRWVELVDLGAEGTILRTGELWTGEGGLALVVQRQTTGDPAAEPMLRRRAERRARWAPLGHSRIDTPSYPVRSSDGLLGPVGVNFDYEHRFDGSVARSSVSIGFPLWLLILVTGVYPMLRFIMGVMRRERQERILLGLCPRCGVDVRQDPQRCPCCGKRQPLLLPQRVAA